MNNFSFLIPLFERYQKVLYSACSMDLPEQDKCDALHLKNMCDVAIKGIKDQTMAYGKLCRWLGFIQGVMCSAGLINVDEERDFTRPIFKENEV